MKKETYELSFFLLSVLLLIAVILLIANGFRGYELEEATYGVMFNYLVFVVSPILIIGSIASAVIGASGIEQLIKSLVKLENKK